jgi:hypothetical protein
MHKNHNVPLEKMTVINNFLLVDHFKKKITREPHRFIYASSPDRGLITLLKMWPKILARWSDAKLGIFYGWDGCMKLGGGADAAWNERYRALRLQYNKLRWQPGIEEYGRVNHERIAEEYMRASVWAYPTDFAETFCSSAIKARAGGCVPVCTPYAALTESALCDQTKYVQFGGADYEDRFVDAIASVIHMGEGERLQMAIEAFNKFELGNGIAAQWRNLLEGK